jgi:4-hydroxybenzoate polyprenyltransferase
MEDRMNVYLQHIGLGNKRRPSDVLRGFFWLCHPGPMLFNVTAVTAFALLASWPNVNWKVIALASSAHLTMQLSIAILNDYCDRERDVLSKKNKPIVRGLVLPREALFTSLLLMVVMVVLLIPLNRWAFLISLLYLAFGQSYNLGLKTTPAGAVVFALALPLIPLYAFVAVSHFVPLVLWQIPISVLLALALHLANTLPDIEQDTANHVHNLAVILGRKKTIAAITALILLAVVFIDVCAATGIIPAQRWLLLPTSVLSALSAGALFVIFRSKESHESRQTYFYLVVVTCLLLAGGWLTSALLQSEALR